MACPLFLPSSPLVETGAIAPPLGDLYDGACAGDASAAIDADMVRRFCNYGYARERCVRAAQSEVDAVRLLVRGDRFGMVQIAWSTERNHHPVAVGQVEVDSLAGPVGVDVLAHQAHACAAAYVRKTRGVAGLVDRNDAAVHR